MTEECGRRGRRNPGAQAAGATRRLRCLEEPKLRFQGVCGILSRAWTLGPSRPPDGPTVFQRDVLHVWRPFGRLHGLPTARRVELSFSSHQRTEEKTSCLMDEGGIRDLLQENSEFSRSVLVRAASHHFMSQLSRVQEEEINKAHPHAPGQSI